MSDKRKNKFFFTLLLILTVVVLYFSLKDHFFDIIYQLQNLNIFWLFIAIILVIGYWLFSSMAMYMISKKFKPDIKFSNIFKLNVVTQFFNGVTPFSSGGQPYQIYALKNEGIDIVDSTNITVETFVAYQVSLIFLGFVAVISNLCLRLFPEVSILKIFVILGFTVNALVGIFLFVIAFTKRFNKFILKFIITVGSNLKIVKDKDRAVIRINEYVNNFHNGAKHLLEDKKNLALVILLQLCGLISLYLVPLPILFGMGDFSSVNVITAVITSAYVMIIGSFIPLPGGTGGLEYSFISFYGYFVADSKLAALMLVWRFLTYYFGMIVGSLVLNFGRRK